MMTFDNAEDGSKLSKPSSWQQTVLTAFVNEALQVADLLISKPLCVMRYNLHYTEQVPINALP
jgi:hypothetical protein